MLNSPIAQSISRRAVFLACAAALAACSKDEETTCEPDTGLSVKGDSALVVVTERESTSGGSLHYLHLLSDWPESGELDYGAALELGQPGVAFVQDRSLYFYHAQAGTIEKFTLDERGKLVRGCDDMSLTGRGISGFEAEPIRASAQQAFVVDEKTGQVVRWDPSKLEIDAVQKIDSAVLKRDGMAVQFQLGVAAGSRVFTTASWRDWGTNTVAEVAALGVFEQSALDKGMQIVEDERCAPSVAIGPFVDEDYVYLVSDGAQGYDLLASPNKVTKPQCVVRMRTDADAFDKDYFIDLQALTKTPAIFAAFPMRDHKLLVHQWSADEDVAERMTTEDAAWFWDRPSVYEFVIVDLKDKKVTKVDLPLASARSPKTLIVDQDNYVQLFDERKAATLYRVNTDGSAVKVLSNAASTNVQFLGRL